MQREIEAAGFTTITLTPVPEVTASISAPRLVAIEYPLGVSLGLPGDATGQMAVLRATLHALQRIQTPGEIIHLPFEWTENKPEFSGEPPSPPPIVGHLLSHPWQVSRLIKRKIS